MSGADDKLRGKWDEAKGKAKQAWGDATDNEDVRAEGEWDETKGRGRNAMGNLKDAADDVRDAKKDILDDDKP